MLSDDKILKRSSAARQVVRWKSEGKKIVFTNGCFDLLHLGHVDYLEKAREQGDVLVVGLNSDKSVKSLKGPQRPIMEEYGRARLLAAMYFIDMVVLFDEDTPYDLIVELMPDILIKGKDYNVSNIVGADVVMKNGGKVVTIDLVEGYSTSKIIDHIKRL
jgi:rfaE bifunctional protein nucleotidyltransferase chain/domain